MSDNELEKIRQKKAEMLLKMQSMPKNIININNEQELTSLTSEFSDKIIVIDFWAVWCSPCKMFAPTFEKLQQEFYGDFIFAKINVDENPLIAQYLGISSIPTTVLLKNNQVLRKFVGAMNYGTLKQILEKIKNQA
ncbi:MAG: thioredoxin [Promethearchaeota archaeon]|jgi:thioredoxin 1